jgi:hypothetical protein
MVGLGFCSALTLALEPLTISMHKRIKPWQKKMVTKRMMRIRSIVNSLLLMFLVIDSARSARVKKLG